MPWIGATLLGALVPAAIVSIMIIWHGPSAVMLPASLLALVVTLGHTLILGLPVALLYHAKRWHQPGLAVATGFLIGGVPVGVLGWIAGGPKNLFAVILFGGLGVSGALAFWLVLRCSGTLGDASAE